MKTLLLSKTISPGNQPGGISFVLIESICFRFPVCALIIACLGGGFAARIHAGEPSSTSPQAAPTEPAATPPAVVPKERTLGESELLQLLTAALQEEYVGDRGELELRFIRPWDSIKVPGEPLTLKILEMPNAGVTTTFIVRFELHAGKRILGNWQAPVRAQIWREIWVAGSALRRGDRVATANITRERRDVLTIRSPLADFPEGDTTLELAEPLQAGSPLLARSVRVRPVVHRGQMADALVRDGALSVTTKVEVLEDGAPGQIVRARNPQSHRDLSGRVLNEQTILISL